MLTKIKFLYFKLISANKVAKILGVKYGDNCHFGTKNFGSEPYLIEIGNDFKTSSGVQFITHDGSVHVLRNLYSDLRNIDLFGKIIIGNNVFVGFNAIILPGTIIGDNVIVGAGSIVRGKLEPNSVYAGVPIRYICSIQEYKGKHFENFMYTKSLSSTAKKEQLLEKFENS